MLRVIAAALVFGWSTLHDASGLLAEHPDGPASSSQWQEGWADLVNHRSRVYGYFINWNDHFYFRGNAEVCNEFLNQYAALWKKGDVVLLSRGPGSTTRHFREENVIYDWEVAITGGTHISITIHPGGKIKLSELAVPGTLQVQESSPLQSVKLDGPATPADDAAWQLELKAFAAAHAAKRAELKLKRD